MTTEVPNNPTLPKPWSPDELAAFSGLDRKTVYSSIAKGEIPTVRIGRRFLIPAGWIEARFGRTDAAR